MLNSKLRFRVLILCILVCALPAIINQIAVGLNLDVNPADINLYQENNTVEYSYTNGTLGHSAKLTLEITVPDSKDITNVTANLGGVVTTFQCDYSSGYWIDNGTLTNNYTLFWILVQNPMLHGWEFRLYENTSVVDPVGLIGPVGEIYTLIIGEDKVYWDVAPALDGAQFSFIIDLYDSNNTKVADGLMDSTCGFLEVLSDGQMHLEALSAGNFKISRNRYIMLWWGIALAIAIPVASYLIMKWRGSEKETIEEFTLLTIVGTSAIFIDITIDVWFYARLGFVGMLILHLATLIGYSLVCIRLKYGFKWVIPAILEVAFIFAITEIVGDPYVPHITAFLGLIVTFVVMLFRSSIDKKEIKEKLEYIF